MPEVDSKIVLDGHSFLWEESDKIVVNGNVSTKTTVLEGGKKASFTLPAVSAPYNFIAPASVYSAGKVNLPFSQNYRAGSFDSAASVLMCKSSTLDISPLHTMSYIKVTVSSAVDTENIRSIEIVSIGGENLSGDFVPDYETATLAGASEGKGVKVDCGEAGIAQGTPIYVAVPARTYASGIKLRIVDVSGHYMDKTSTKAFNAAAGTIYTTSLDFVPTGTIFSTDIEPLNHSATTKILFIGNSHTYDATSYLPDLLRAENVRNIELTRVYHGGYYIKGYNDNFSLPNNCSVETWKPGQFRWRGGIMLDHSLQSVVESDTYDIVVLQEYVGVTYCYKEWSAAEKDAINGLIGKIRRTSPSAEFVYYLSHCWADNYSKTIELFEGSSDKMFNMCVENNLRHVMDPAEGFPFTKFVSTAALVQSLRTSGLNVPNGKYLFRGDGCHLDYGLGRCSAAMLMWKTLVTPITGIEVEDLKYRFREYYPAATRYTTPLIDENLPTVLAAINAAYEHPDRITNLSSYTNVPDYVNVPGSYGLAMENVDVEPVTFPVEWAIGVKNGAGSGWLCNSETNPYWTGNTFFSSTQKQAIAKWVSIENPVPNMVYDNTFVWANPSNSVLIKGVWTGDYYEFVIPVQNFRAGSTVRAMFPIYLSDSPAFWYIDYQDGEEWTCNHSVLSTSDGSFSHDASFVCAQGQNRIAKDLTFTHGISNGFLRIRLRCANGRIQTTSTGFVERDTPYQSGGSYGGQFYFYGTEPISFDLVDMGKKQGSS